MIQKKRKKIDIEKIVIITFATIFMGEIYINPIPGPFRLSMAVLTLTLLLVFLKEVPVILVCSIIAVLTPIFRTFIHFFTFDDVTFYQSFLQYYPVAAYYFLYGFIFELLDIRKKLDNPILLMAALWFCDSMPNVAEALIRRLFTTFEFDIVVLNIILAGLIRTALTYLVYLFTVHYKRKYDRQQKEIKYREMVLFISSLKSELFFLKKSMADIEHSMQMIYDLYIEMKDKLLKERLLTISKNVHEIKKDYYRVVNGIENVLSEKNEKLSMNIIEIFEVIEDNCKHIIASHDKNINIEFYYEENFETSEFYPLISVLNNLIINSIDAIEDDGFIIVEEKSEEEHNLFRVSDNGTGIDSEAMEILFEPGYSTKYDPVTGRMSTGLGLSHVKQLVETYFEGSISVYSSITKMTIFEARIPKSNINLKG